MWGVITTDSNSKNILNHNLKKYDMVTYYFPIFNNAGSKIIALFGAT